MYRISHDMLNTLYCTSGQQVSKKWPKYQMSHEQGVFQHTFSMHHGWRPLDGGQYGWRVGWELKL